MRAYLFLAVAFVTAAPATLSYAASRDARRIEPIREVSLHNPNRPINELERCDVAVDFKCSAAHRQDNNSTER